MFKKYREIRFKIAVNVLYYKRKIVAFYNKLLKKAHIFLWDIEIKLHSAKNKINEYFDKVSAFVRKLRISIGKTIENRRIDKVQRLESKIGKIKGKIGYQ